MAEGKFSKPRPHREEDRQIEQAFRQVTGQEPVSRRPAYTPPPEEEVFDLFPETEDQAPDPFREAQAPDPGFQGTRDPLRKPEEPVFEEPQQEPKGSFLDTLQDFGVRAMDFYDENKKLVLACLCAVALVLIVSITAVFFFSTSDPYDGRILNNVLIGGVNVGGMTKNEAITAVNQAIGQSYATQDMVVDLDGTTLRLSASEVGAKLDVKAAVSAAYDFGRTGTKAEQEKAQQKIRTGNHIIGLLPYLDLNEDYIRETLESYAGDSGSTLTQAKYGLEGQQPELSADKFDINAPCQTLVITMGTPGVGFDVEAVYNQILDAYSLHEFLVTVEDIEPAAEPDPVDLEAIYEEFYIAPVDATVDLRTYEVIPGSYGYSFDLEAAQKLVDKAGYGEEVRIPMEYIEPELLDDDSFFQDVLGQCQTPYSGSSNRTANLKLACQALDGLVLNPGQTFSFQDTVGQPTSAKGYKSAPSDSGDGTDVLGGGLGQVSSTLYWCSLLADLQTISRVSHSLAVSYIDYGLDAAYSWGGADFQFKNTTSFPIKIQAQVSGGYVKIQILGTEQRSYYIRMESSITNTLEPETEYIDYPFDNTEGYRDGDVIQEGVRGYYVKTYKLKYDSQTNTLLSRDFEANTQYQSVKRTVARVEPEPTEPPTEAPETTEPPKPTDPAPTVPPTTEAAPEPTESPVTESPEPPAPEAPAA